MPRLYLNQDVADSRTDLVWKSQVEFIFPLVFITSLQLQHETIVKSTANRSLPRHNRASPMDC